MRLHQLIYFDQIKAFHLQNIRLKNMFVASATFNLILLIYFLSISVKL